MHYHCEIVIPPTDDVRAAVELVMAPFSEHRESDDEHSDKYAFWDYYVIGGRWAGAKLMAKFDPAKIEAFEKWMQEQHITVSGLQWGKQELQPASQIAIVDAKWNEMFDTGTPCPMFKHSNGRGETLPDDVMRLRDVPERLKALHVIIGGPSFENGAFTGPVEAKWMITEDAYNGCNWMKVDWDRRFWTAVDDYKKRVSDSSEPYKTQHMPTNDWLVVTVDYHS